MNEKSAPAKGKILEVASRLFHQQGYNATGVNQIIEKADVAKGSLYHFFSSKEALCIEYLNQRHTYWFGMLQEYTSAARSPKQKVLAAFDFIYDMNRQENFRGCSFLNILSEISVKEKEILEVIQSHKQDLRDFFSEQLQGYHQDIADHVYLLFESAIIESQLFRDQWPVEKSKKLVNAFLSASTPKNK